MADYSPQKRKASTGFDHRHYFRPGRFRSQIAVAYGKESDPAKIKMVQYSVDGVETCSQEIMPNAAIRPATHTPIRINRDNGP